MEHKIIRCFNSELRSSNDIEKREVTGYALKFDKTTQIGSAKYGWKEKIDKKALKDTDMSDTIFSFNHNFDKILARGKSLRLEIDDVGLKITAQIVDTTDGRDAYKLIKDGLIYKMSFAATVIESKWKIAETVDELEERTIMKFGKLLDVSAVTFPAYNDTSIQLRTDNSNEIYHIQIQRLDKILKKNKGSIYEI